MYFYFCTFVGVNWSINAVAFGKFIAALSRSLILNNSATNIKFYTASWKSLRNANFTNASYLICWIFFHYKIYIYWIPFFQSVIKRNTLPKIILEGAQTSNVSFLYPLITQWYWNFSTGEQSWCNAIPLQFFLRAALSHSVLEVGQDFTISTLSTASWQYIFSLLHTYLQKKKK